MPPTLCGPGSPGRASRAVSNPKPRVRTSPGAPGGPNDLRGFPESFGDARALVGLANPIQILGGEQADLGEGLEDRSLAIDEREAHARELLPLRVQEAAHRGEPRVELPALLRGPLDDGGDEAEA